MVQSIQITIPATPPVRLPSPPSQAAPTTVHTAIEIKSIPTVLIFHKGKIIRQFNGIGSESIYRTALDEIL